MYDADKPCMNIGSVYPSMKEFRLAMRQFAINEEFELAIKKTDRTRYIANCNADDCPWHIVGRTQPDERTVASPTKQKTAANKIPARKLAPKRLKIN